MLPMAHLAIFSAATGVVYYGTAALFDAMLLMLLLSHGSKLAIHLAWVNVAAIAINCTGWVLYEMGASSDYYETMICTAIYAQFFRMLWITDHDVRELDRIDNWGGVVYLFTNSRYSSNIESDKCKAAKS